ncbi:hypothetical protein P691DRAFT_800519 [Macrolepiota fuliginosa MF-IS2]|uniref:F-box domain-containing protein n=1 Tax=Macrolepiota fuliginosa MF-IS2 TaxID=1400762 RepID=A0A9P6C4B8_9AGAR|nr:hypothetical protein P691DRAFT_800519 [Macrolepiota fuliginosa MF-IS2]
MSEQQATSSPNRFYSFFRGEIPESPVAESSNVALGDQAPFMMGSREMAAFMATMSPEQQEAFEVRVAQHRGALRLEERRNARKMAERAASLGPKNLTRLDLPPEILTRIFLHLPFTSVVVCTRVNHLFRSVISSSTELQYYIHLGTSGLVDNPHYDLTVPERLTRLLAREHRWEKLEFDFDRNIDVPVVAPYRRRGLSGGFLAMLYQDGTLRELQIPNEADQDVKWREAHPEQNPIISGKRVYEHDLCILTTARRRNVLTNAAIHEVCIRLNRSSTGQPHSDAHGVISFETHGEFGQPWAAAECIGDNLVLILRDNLSGYTPDDEVYVFEWKTGKLKMRLGAPSNSYSLSLFLTEHIFILPNAATGELEYWRIPQHLSESTPERPFFILSLPRLCSHSVFHRIYCRAEPHPGPQGVSKPFYTDPHHAIIIFKITIYPTGTPQTVSDFVFFVHRSSLVEILETFSASISSDERPKPLPYDDWGPSVCRWFNDSVDGYRIGNITAVVGQKFVTSAKSGPAPLILRNFNQIDVAKALATERRISAVGTRDQTSQEPDQNGGCIIGELSGGENTMGSTGKGKEVSSQTHGASALKISSNPPAEGTDPSLSEPQLPAKGIVRSRDTLHDPTGCFENTVYSSLPYTVCSSQGEYNFSDILLSEESILGLCAVGGWNYVKEVRVLHCG